MLSGETGKITFGRINYNLGLGAKEFLFVYNILVQCTGADFKVIGIKFMTVYYVKGCGILLARVTTISPL
jgi:hypothetical protein